MTHKKLTERRILIGLIILLFATSFINTVGILNMSRGNQKAQVVNAGNACMQVTQKYTMADIAPYEQDPTNYETYNMNIDMSVKNICTSNVYMISPFNFINGNPLPGEALNGPLYYGALQMLSNDQVSTISLPTNTYGVKLLSEYAQCVGCANYLMYTATGVNTAGSVMTFSIAPGETKTYRYSTSFKIPLGMSSYNFLAVNMGSFKWFKQAALTDNTVASTEVYTYVLPIGSMRTSFLRD
jgi:hypothetical protein